MSRTYTCPACKAVLNPEHAVILRGMHEDHSILMGFHPDPGNYELFLPEQVPLTPGAAWKFSCPMCGADLQAGVSGRVCLVEMAEAGEETKKVFFSRVMGQRFTFVVSRDGEVQRFGNGDDDDGEPQFDFLV